MTDEYETAVNTFDLGIGDVRKLALGGFKSAFMPYRKKRTVTQMAIEEFDALVEEFSKKQGASPDDKHNVMQEIQVYDRGYANSSESTAAKTKPKTSSAKASSKKKTTTKKSTTKKATTKKAAAKKTTKKSSKKK